MNIKAIHEIQTDRQTDMTYTIIMQYKNTQSIKHIHTLIKKSWPRIAAEDITCKLPTAQLQVQQKTTLELEISKLVTCVF